MSAFPNLPQSSKNGESIPPNYDNPITSRTTTHTKSLTTGLIIPAGTEGRILGGVVKDGFPHWLIDFGLLAVLLVPVNSPLIEIVGGER